MSVIYQCNPHKEKQRQVVYLQRGGSEAREIELGDKEPFVLRLLTPNTPVKTQQKFIITTF
jgi:hypothetical protein